MNEAQDQQGEKEWRGRTLQHYKYLQSGAHSMLQLVTLFITHSFTCIPALVYKVKYNAFIRLFYIWITTVYDHKDHDHYFNSSVVPAFAPRQQL